MLHGKPGGDGNGNGNGNGEVGRCSLAKHPVSRLNLHGLLSNDDLTISNQKSQK